jgi:hypothetical protein
MPSTPPLPSNTNIPSTPPTSPQRHQQAARNQERNQRLIGSPEQRRTPTIPLRLPVPPNPPPVIVEGRELNHLPFELRMQMVGIPPHQPIRRRGHAPPRPFPIPPPLPPPSYPPPPPPLASTNPAITNPAIGSGSATGSGSAIGSGSMAPPVLGPGFVPILPLPPPLPPLASSLRQTLDSAQLRALYESIPHLPDRHHSVSYIYSICLFLLFTNFANN